MIRGDDYAADVHDGILTNIFFITAQDIRGSRSVSLRVFIEGDAPPVAEVLGLADTQYCGLARPCVVGYVDVGYGSKGAAVFTGSITPSDYPVRSILIGGRPSAQLSGAQAKPNLQQMPALGYQENRGHDESAATVQHYVCNLFQRTAKIQPIT